MTPSPIPTAAVPVVDFGLFLNGSPEDQKAVAGQIDDAFRDLGFVHLKNHGVPVERVKECFDWSERFFNLPYDTKMLAPHPPGGSHHRGYSGLGEEQVSQNTYDAAEISKLRETLPDSKESFESGNVNDENQPNIWLPEEALPGFRGFMEDFFKDCTNLTHSLLNALTLSLSLNPETHALSPTHSKSLFQLRLLHYPPLPLTSLLSNTRTRISAHSDFGTLTLLFQDSVGGLEIQDPTQKTPPATFVPVEPICGELGSTVLVNVGDLLMRWSNNRWKSAVHRVGAPAGLKNYEKTKCGDADGSSESESSSQEVLKPVNGQVKFREIMVPSRYSVPFFATADDEAVIDALPGTFGEGRPKEYEPTTAREYVQMRMAALYANGD